MCDDYAYFFDRARIAEELRANRKKADEPKPQIDAAPTAPVAEARQGVNEQETVPV